MKVIKPFFLGVLGGLGLALALLVAIYFSPLRETVYFAADPEMADIRSKLDRYQDWLAQTDLRIAAQAIGGEHASDSLQSAQAKAWRDYKGWRNRLGELARAYAQPSAEAFWPWAYSLRFWILPIGAGLALLPGLFCAWRARNRFRAGRVRSPVKPANAARAQALSNFEDAIKKVARISESERREPIAPSPLPVSPQARALPVKDPPTEILPSAAYPGTRPPPVAPPAPAAAPLQPVAEARPERDPGEETHYLERGAPWGEPMSPLGERIGAPGPIAGAPSSRLSMEDEDGTDSRDSDEAGEETLGVMPPTTEVERVERRKDQVLKLARKGMTSSEISKRMRISQDQVEFIIRLRREKG
ncbi:MAG: hypothetical protein ABI036_19440 [Fibrobacteria bacterium]